MGTFTIWKLLLLDGAFCVRVMAAKYQIPNDININITYCKHITYYNILLLLPFYTASPRNFLKIGAGDGERRGK